MRWPFSRRTRRESYDAGQVEPASDIGAVHLGFTDGSELELGGGDPHALALKAVADVLMQQERA